MAINYAFTGIPVADYPAALVWYERLLGRPPDVIVHDHEAMWQLRDAAWVYVVADAVRAGNALLTVLMDDLESQLAALAARGLTPATIENAPGLYRKAVFEDPEGNTIGFGENLNAQG